MSFTLISVVARIRVFQFRRGLQKKNVLISTGPCQAITAGLPESSLITKLNQRFRRGSLPPEWPRLKLPAKVSVRNHLSYKLEPLHSREGSGRWGEGLVCCVQYPCRCPVFLLSWEICLLLFCSVFSAPVYQRVRTEGLHHVCFYLNSTLRCCIRLIALHREKGN